MVDIQMSNQQSDISLPSELQDYWLSICHEVCLYLQITNKEISIAFVDNDTIKELNTSYRQKPSVTDVLSFPLTEVESDDLVLGEIIVSIPRAQTQADALGHSLQREVVFLLIHGLLHLAGYDHDETHAGDMRREEKVIFNMLNLDNNKTFN